MDTTCFQEDPWQISFFTFHHEFFWHEFNFALLTISSGGNISSWVGSNGRNSSSEKSFRLVLKRESTRSYCHQAVLPTLNLCEWGQMKIDTEQTDRKAHWPATRYLGSKPRALTQTRLLATVQLRGPQPLPHTPWGLGERRKAAGQTQLRTRTFPERPATSLVSPALPFSLISPLERSLKHIFFFFF